MESFITYAFRNISVYSLMNLVEEIANNEENWKSFYTSAETMELPEPYASANQLQQLLILKCLRPDAILSAIRKFICAFDETFIESVQIDLKSAFECSTTKTPLIFFTSTGINATDEILSLAHEVNIGDK